MTSYTQRRKGQIHDLLGGKCKHCGEKDPRVLQIDHVYGDGAKERREGLTRMQLYRNIEKDTRRYQLLCANCNWKKRDKDFERNKIQGRSSIRTVLGRILIVVTVFLLIFVFLELTV